MNGLTYEFLLARGGFATLAQLFPDEPSTRLLLEDIGVSAVVIGPFGYSPAESYWRKVGHAIEDGRFVDVDLDCLIAGALRHYPRNGSLNALVAGAGAASAPANGSSLPAAGPGWPRPQGELRVLCLAAGPADLSPLRLGVEHREILAATERSARPVTVLLHPATRAADLVRRVLDAEPDILHFGGHGSANGMLLLEDDDGLSVPVDLPALARLLATLPRLQAIVLTSCYSGGYAQLLSTASDIVIGSPQPLKDACALGFVEPFYRALGKGRDIREAFAFASAALAVLGCPPHQLMIAPAA